MKRYHPIGVAASYFFPRNTGTLPNWYYFAGLGHIPHVNIGCRTWTSDGIPWSQPAQGTDEGSCRTTTTTSSVMSWQPPQWRHVNLLSDVMATSSVTSWQPPQWRLGNLTLCNMTSISTRHFIKFDVICNFDLAFRHHYIVEITGGFFILLL